MSKWYDVYVERMNERYLTHIKRRYRSFITEILKHAPRQRLGLFREEGCGAANITRILLERSQGLHDCVDFCDRMLSLARMNLKSYPNNVSLWHGDIRNPPIRVSGLTYDVIHAHGVLEHFPDKDIRTIVEHQLAHARAVVHYVPGEKYEKPSFGCERLMSQKQWKKICSPDKIKTFNDGYDYILIWRS